MVKLPCCDANHDIYYLQNIIIRTDGGGTGVCPSCNTNLGNAVEKKVLMLKLLMQDLINYISNDTTDSNTKKKLGDLSLNFDNDINNLVNDN